MKLTSSQKDVFLLTAVSAFVLLWNIWTGSLLSWDEAFYGSVSKEILRTGDWINLYWAGSPWSDKPPLYMWVTNVFYNLFGINEFSVRLFSSLCGTGTVVAVYLLSRELYSRRAAVASSLVLLTTWHFIWSSKVGMLDSTLTFFITLSLLLFQLGLTERKFLFFVPIAFALAFLTKGPGAAVIPLIILMYAFLSKKPGILLDARLVAGAFIAAAVLLWWHLAVYANYGQGFIKDYFIKHLVMRTTTAVEGHTGDLLTYFGTIPNKGRPWSMAGLVLLPLAAAMAIFKKEKQHLLPIIWAGSVILIFSAVQTKIHWYIVPVYPALAILTGWGIEKIAGKYTIPVVLALSTLSLIYLTVEKNIFDLDYSPSIKETYLEVLSDTSGKEKLFLYDISDPGMQFYLGWEGNNIRNEKALRTAMRSGDVYILLNKNNAGRLGSEKYRVISEYPDHMLIRPGDGK